MPQTLDNRVADMIRHAGLFNSKPGPVIYMTVREYSVYHKKYQPAAVLYRGPDYDKAMEKARDAVERCRTATVWVTEVRAETAAFMREVAG